MEQQAEWFARGIGAQMDGVDCAACHVRDGRWFGPRAVGLTAHGSVEAHTLFRRSEFCATCHQFGQEGLALNGKLLENTVEEWRVSSYAHAGVTCQDCHMPDGEHSFKGIHDADMTRRGLAITVKRARGELIVQATNAGAGHALPTYTTPSIRIELSGAGRRLDHDIRRALAWSDTDGLRETSDTRLLPGESVTIALPLPARATSRVVVQVDPEYDYHQRIYPALLASLGPQLPERAREALKSARRQSQRLGYELYRFECRPWRENADDLCSRQ
jgi:hypothetical protein